LQRPLGNGEISRAGDEFGKLCICYLVGLDEESVDADWARRTLLGVVPIRAQRRRLGWDPDQFIAH
jgi:hypothetical protein